MELYFDITSKNISAVNYFKHDKMKKIKFLYIVICSFFISSITACKKDNAVPTVAALNIINASADLTKLTVNFTQSPVPFYKQLAQIGYGASAEYSEPTGTVPITLISSADTLHHFFQGTLHLAPGDIYSLYVYGKLPSIDTLLLKDNNIPIHKDSTCGVRFINLSTDSGPLSVNVQGSSTVDFTNIAFKNITVFKTYPLTTATINNGGYTFEVKDAGGNVLTTFSWSFKIFQNNTVVVTGSKASNSVQVIQVNNY